MEEKEKQTSINLIQKSTIYKLIIPEEVESKIRFICNNVWNVEWSGVLFYDYEGSFDDGTLTITAKDIFVMDIGNTTYTEFDMSPEVISYMTEHPELLGYQTGLIHSHNNMTSFFSQTDVNTLKEEGNDTNHFVSLIVNNVGNYTARITRKVQSIKDIRESISYNSFNDEKKESSSQYYEKSEVIEAFNLQIIKEEKDSYKELTNRFDSIRKAKAATIKTQNSTPYKVIDAETAKKPATPFAYNAYDKPSSAQKEIEFEDNSDNEKVRHYALQLVTGSIVAPNSSSAIDIKKWVKSMPTIYGKRFGNDAKGRELYEEWVASFTEFLINSADIEYNRVNDYYAYSALVQSIIDYLTPMDDNYYIQTIISELENYLIYE